MKGSELLSDIVLLFILIGVSFIAGGLVLWVINVTDSTGWGSTYSLILNPIHQPIKYQVMTMAYLETTHNGVPVKNIVIEAIEQGDPYAVDIDSDIVDLRDLTEPIYDEWFGNSAYIFLIDVNGEQKRIAGSSKLFIDLEGKKISIRKLVVPIKSYSNEGEMLLYVRG